MIIGIDASRAVTGQRTGTEAYAYFLIKALLAHTAVSSQHTHTIRLYFNQPPPPDLFPANEHLEQRIIPFPRLWTHLRLGWELQQDPPDLFFTPAHVIPWSYRGASAATIHDLGYHHFPEAHPQRQLAYLRWSTRHNGRRSRLVIADSEATKADLVQIDGVDPAKIAVIYPGVDPLLQPVTDERILTQVWAKYGIKPPYFIYLSTLQPRKNLVRLLQAFAAADLPHQLVLAGRQGWLAEPILAAHGALPTAVRRRVLLPGYIPDADKAPLLSGAAALVYPSLYEGFGFPVLEAQACATPVITAAGSSLPEVGGDGALYVDPLDIVALTSAIKRIAVDASLRARLITAGQENIARFSWQKSADRLWEQLVQATF
jgi:glycosyltransferase involved in cell wall biosynthesis